MLVLSRLLGEKLRIGEATVTIVDISGGKVRLGIEAPPSVVIRREELVPLVHDDPDALPTIRAAVAESAEDSARL